ncbi:DNA polymerase III subunit epsilon [Pseudovibrio sp. Ad13]|uniref:DNA polymerase III subunit epsilon n=1 Tax=unclassified Pseudovibrio TaxID=2627060 RepID=UPI00070B50D9|nr:MULTISPECIES: DNA polymerase III subunit epsilon [unclassified Pseudovibrio]KZK87086.1 DNA polymerase III subunit epsilon [Pseudovibrio sp. Ad13]KZL00715.1 DNA polymerase III subunit epsilon [Pseudovibrio sp. Ad5]
MREISFDTETTGLNPLDGDRLVEIGGVELINFIPTGRTCHLYVNPQRDMPEEAFRIHGLSAEFLSDKPLFVDVADEFLDFVGDSRLVIHNAPFDMGFINMELGRCNKPKIPNTQVLDTLKLARRKFPTGSVSLDALCSRYGVDNTKRVYHGALLDAELLAEVYLEMNGGKQKNLGLMPDDEAIDLDKLNDEPKKRVAAKQRPNPLSPSLSEEEIEAHAKFLAGMKSDPAWNKYLK